MYVDPKTRTTATLYGNERALAAAHARGGAPAYTAGAVLALVTWAQRDDPHWFGARIPSVPQSMEFVEVATDGRPGSSRIAVLPTQPRSGRVSYWALLRLGYRKTTFGGCTRG
jgi:hypothetical protein